MTFAPWLDAFVPVFGLLALGAALRRRLLREDAVWAGIERLVFWVLLPCLIAGALAQVSFGALPVGGMAAALWGALAAGTAASVLLARALGHGHAAMTSVLQGGIRFNNLVGFAVAGAIWGAPGIALAAVATGLIVPFVQTVATLAFALGRDRPRRDAEGRESLPQTDRDRPGRDAEGRESPPQTDRDRPGRDAEGRESPPQTSRGSRVRPLPLLRQVLLNPLILGCVAGFALGAVGGLPPGLQPMLRSLGQASVALGLLCVGAALTLQGLGDRPGTQAATAALKLLGMPAITWALCAAIGLEPLPTALVVLFMALPTAATSYVMARAMGGDAKLMAAITTSEHLLAVLTLPVWVWVLTR